jgi:hypothetical protein
LSLSHLPYFPALSSPSPTPLPLAFTYPWGFTNFGFIPSAHNISKWRGEERGERREGRGRREGGDSMKKLWRGMRRRGRKVLWNNLTRPNFYGRYGRRGRRRRRSFNSWFARSRSISKKKKKKLKGWKGVEKK